MSDATDMTNNENIDWQIPDRMLFELGDRREKSLTS